METLEKAEQLKAELDSLRPLDAEAEARIMQKFRLDWNYHSNNLEGNSLTYGETKALILFGITAQGKPLKDHFEITGHNEAINWVLELVKGKTELTEVFIRELHTLLLKEPSFKKAKTPDGKTTRRKIEVGKYKTQPNHVITVTGETFYFATPDETPAKMQELVEWFRLDRGKHDLSPIILAALFHYKFIRIHPFDDGNGRVARILMNFILMQFGYPPVIIKTEDKENYYTVLRLADADQLEPFIDYIALNLIRSLEIMIRGAKGEIIEEPEDLDKELSLLEAKLDDDDRKITKAKSRRTLLETLEESIRPLYDEFIRTCEKFDRFYVTNSFLSKLDGYCFDSDKTTNLAEAEDEIKEARNGLRYSSLQMEYTHSYFNKESYPTFSHSSSLYVNFTALKYRVRNSFIYKNVTDENVVVFEKLYSEPLSSSEINLLVRSLAKEHRQYLEEKLSASTPESEN